MEDDEIHENHKTTITHQVFYLYPQPRDKCNWMRIKGKQSEKIQMLLQLLKEHDDNEAVIVFTNTIRAAESVEKALLRAGHRPGTLHREKTRNKREEIMEGFKNKRYNVLVSTDVKVVMPDASHVINYDVVSDIETFKRRLEPVECSSAGVATTLVSDSDSRFRGDGEGRREVLGYLKEILVENNIPVPYGLRRY